MVLLVAGIVLLLYILDTPETIGSDQVYYVDLSAMELFTADFDESSPTVAPSGGEGYQVYLTGCGDCGDRESLAGWARQGEGEGVTIAAFSVQTGLKEPWLADNSVEASNLERVRLRCGPDVEAVACFPE